MVLCLTATAAGSTDAAAQGTSDRARLQIEIAERDQLIVSQESLLNVYRCMFDVDTDIVTGGCAHGRPVLGPPELRPFTGTPTQRDVDVRNKLVGAQESLLNVYRCTFNIDTQIVPFGCVDGRPGDGPATPESSPVPIEGVRVKMARADWSTGFLQAAIYRALLIELGYDVSDPAQATLAPVTFYPALARGEYDFWVNGWFPHHDNLARNSFQSGIASPVGWQMQSGGLQGFVVDKATADAYGITKLDDIGNNPRLAALFDLDGDGKADLMGCNHGWGCREIINDTIAANGWRDTIEQVSAEHATLFSDSVQRHRRGQALLQYVWSPSSLPAQLVPGTDVIWLSLDNPLPARNGVANLPVHQCPGQPCKLGFTPADIRVVARNDFLAANPAAAKLFELVAISPYDVSQHSLQSDRGSNTEFDVRAAAHRWIAANRAKVDVWLTAARTASGQPSARAEPEPESTSDSIVAGFVFASPVGDAGWSWAHDQGRRYAERQTGATTLFVENILETKEAFRPVAVDLIENDGADIIFGTAFGYMDVMEELAGEYPDVVFEHASGFKLNDLNFGNYFGRIYQPRYLSGIAAGAMTESDRIGYVAAFPIPEVIRGINAFTLGVRRINPDAEVHVYWTFTWFDPTTEALATAALLEDGADVITMHQESIRLRDCCSR